MKKLFFIFLLIGSFNGLIAQNFGFVAERWANGPAKLEADGTGLAPDRPGGDGYAYQNFLFTFPSFKSGDLEILIYSFGSSEISFDGMTYNENYYIDHHNWGYYFSDRVSMSCSSVRFRVKCPRGEYHGASFDNLFIVFDGETYNYDVSIPTTSN